MNRVLVRLYSVSLHHQLVTAVFIILLAAAYSASSPQPTAAIDNGLTETGNPSVLFDTDKISRSLLRHVIPHQPGLINCHVEHCVALTFDDGPETATTPKVLDVLKTQAAPATFFVLGNKVAPHADILKRMQAEGHEIGNHSWDHPAFTKLRADQMLAELDQTNQALATAGVKPARLFRPPYGSINRRVTDTVKMPLILWNTDPRDWSAGTTPAQEAAAVIASVRPGAIVVMHDTKASTAAALPEIIRGLRQNGYKLVSVTQLLELNQSSQGVYFGQ